MIEAIKSHLETDLKKSNYGTSITIFILFFGLALLEALKKHNWPEAALFLLLGIVSFWADLRKN